MTISKRFDQMTHDEQDVILYTISGKEHKETLDRVMAACGPDGEYTIEITINGIKVDAESFVQRYNKAFDRCVDRAADEKVREKFSELTQAFEPIRDMLAAAERDLAAKLGIERDSWGDY